MRIGSVKSLTPFFAGRGGTWVLLVRLAASRTGALPRAISILGLAIAGVGTLPAIPGLSALAGAFGPGQIAWFTGLGFVPLRREPARS